MTAKILTPQQLAKIQHSIPYIYHYKKRTKELLILGSDHTNNPQHPQFKTFKKLFLKLKPDVIFVEGGWENSTPEKTEREAIQKGEMCYLVYLATKHKIPIKGWDIPDKKQTTKLKKYYTKDELFAHFILRTLPQYIRRGKNKKELTWTLKTFKKETGWKNYNYTITNLKQIHKKIFNKTLNLNKIKEEEYNIAPYTLPGDPALGPSILNKIAAKEMTLRDKHATKKITKELQKKNKILAIMGASHAITQEPTYKEQFNTKTTIKQEL